jgi:hypothetical protein
MRKTWCGKELQKSPGLNPGEGREEYLKRGLRGNAAKMPDQAEMGSDLFSGRDRKIDLTPSLAARPALSHGFVQEHARRH